MTRWPADAGPTTHVSLDTCHGRVVAAIFTQRAPLTAGNFLRYVDQGLYEAASFYRAARPANDVRSYGIQVIQGGLGPESELAPPLPPIAHESTRSTGLSHLDGALSATRWAPGTAGSEFFIVIGDTPALDFGSSLNPDLQGYAVFGRVIDGMEAVRRINMSPTGTLSSVAYLENQALMPPVAVRASRAWKQPPH